MENLDHRFLTGGPWRGSGVYEDHKSKVLYPFKPLLYGFGGPPLALIDTLWVREIFFEF
jgi:hypothetical protein